MVEPLIIGYKRVEKYVSATLVANRDVIVKLSDSLCGKQLISSDDLSEKSSPQEKADSLIHAINEALIRSPDNLRDILEEMGKYNCLLEWVTRAKEHEKFNIVVDKVEKDIKEKLRALEKEMREGRAALTKKVEEVMKKAYGDDSVPIGLMKLEGLPDVTTSTTEELIEWMRTEFEHLEKETIRVREERKERDLKRLKERVDKIMEITRREKQFDREIAENIQRAKATAQDLKERMSAINKAENEKFKKEIEELLKNDKKFNEETLDRYLERERRIDAVVEAIDSGTYEIKEVEKSYKSGLVPEWTHPSLPKVSFTVTPVYRIIQGFQEKRENKERIFTEPFYTTPGGYKMTLVVSPNGRGFYKGTHVSVNICLMKGDNDNVLLFPFTGNIIVKALKWSEDDGHVEEIVTFDESVSLESRQRVTDGDRAEYHFGRHDFIPHQDLQPYLLNDMMCFRVSFEGTHFTGTRVPRWYNAVIKSPVCIPPCTVTMYQYSRLKKTNGIWVSKPFYTSERGYKLQLQVYANGDGPGRGTHVSVYVHLMKGEDDDQLQWPFSASITVQLLNWSRDSDHVEKTIPHYEAPIEYRTRVIEGVIASGGQDYNFISHSDLNIDNSDIQYINEDMLCFRIVRVDIIN